MTVMWTPIALDGLQRKAVRVTTKEGDWMAEVTVTNAREPERIPDPTIDDDWYEGEMYANLYANDWCDRPEEWTGSVPRLRASTRQGDWQPLEALVPVEDRDDSWESQWVARTVEEVEVSVGWQSNVERARRRLEESLRGVRAKSVERVIAVDAVVRYAEQVEPNVLVTVADEEPLARQLELGDLRMLVDAVGWEVLGPDRLEELFGASDRSVRDALRALQHFHCRSE